MKSQKNYFWHLNLFLKIFLFDLWFQTDEKKYEIDVYFYYADGWASSSSRDVAMWQSEIHKRQLKSMISFFFFISTNRGWWQMARKSPVLIKKWCLWCFSFFQYFFSWYFLDSLWYFKRFFFSTATQASKNWGAARNYSMSQTFSDQIIWL